MLFELLIFLISFIKKKYEKPTQAQYQTHRYTCCIAQSSTNNILFDGYDQFEEIIFLPAVMHTFLRFQNDLTFQK